MARADRRREADLSRDRARLADLRCPGVPEHRCDAGRDRRDRARRARPREALVRTCREVHGRAVGDARAMKRFVFGTVASFGLAAVVWEAFARSGLFSPALSPSLAVIVPALVQMVVSGSIFVHIAYTLYRILWGLGLAALLGVPVGILMGRFKAAERFVLPLVSVLSPIQSLAWVPVFFLWFGLGSAWNAGLGF